MAPSTAPTSHDKIAWRGASFAGPQDFAVDFTQGERDELVAAIRRLPRGQDLARLSKADVPLPTLGPRLKSAYEDVRSGRGFTLLRGLPTDGLTLEEFTAAVYTIGLYFGRTLSQNAQGEVVTQVVDATKEDATPRMYRSNLELRPHNDITAMISLACWNPALTGGMSVLVSGVTVHDEIKKRAPHLLEALYRGYHYHRLGEEGPDETPVTPYRMPVFTNRSGQISVRYQRAGLAAGHHELGKTLTPLEIEALNMFDAVAAAPENRLAFPLNRGEMVVINNYTVMHARSSFTNFPEPERKRLLVRLWLDADGFRDVPPEFNLFATNGIPLQEGRRCTYDFKKLYREDPVGTGGIPNLRLEEKASS
jgi:hypothetical protein